MGLDPDDDSYVTASALCLACNISLFNGTTPKYVLAVFQDIIACPGIDDPPPNGSYILEQTVPNRCRWEKVIPGGAIWWEIAPGSSTVSLSKNGAWFVGTSGFECIDAFANIITCIVPGVGHEGYCTIWWGPQIGKEPCS